MVMPAVDLAGRRFGFLTVIRREGTSTGRTKKAIWRCRCDCGAEVVRESQSLRSKHRPNAKSCGCKHGAAVSKGRGGHMMTGTRPWVIWQHMRNRCRNPKAKDYRNYGGRGIDMPDEWFDSFSVFWGDVQHGYKDDLTIDRTDNMMSYSKTNFRWVSEKVQMNNTRVNVRVRTAWGLVTMSELSDMTGIAYQTLYRRMRAGKRGPALTRPVSST